MALLLNGYITNLNHSQLIGTHQGWQQRLQERQVKIVGHQVIPLQSQQEIQPKIDRLEISMPLKILLPLESSNF